MKTISQEMQQLESELDIIRYNVKMEAQRHLDVPNSGKDESTDKALNGLFSLQHSLLDMKVRFLEYRRQVQAAELQHASGTQN